MAKIIILVGPPGSGKSTLSKTYVEDFGYVYVNQDSQGKDGHKTIFMDAIADKKDIIVDRMGFNKEQRDRYLNIAKQAGYNTKIIVLHESYQTCLDRVLKRIGSHETIVDEKGARAALQTFFTQYERPTKDEVDEIEFIYPIGPKPKAVICDLDGTLCDVEHRRHHVRLTDEQIAAGKKKNWPAFFAGIPKDPVNEWCRTLLRAMANSGFRVVYCSGRGDNERKATVEWLQRNHLDAFNDGSYEFAPLYMRNRVDSRRDDIVKEIILDFELLTRYEIQFTIDDRDQVVQMWRKRGFTCLQCDEGNF